MIDCKEEREKGDRVFILFYKVIIMNNKKELKSYKFHLITTEGDKDHMKTREGKKTKFSTGNGGEKITEFLQPLLVFGSSSSFFLLLCV